jgi:hypothetical protein
MVSDIATTSCQVPELLIIMDLATPGTLGLELDGISARTYLELPGLLENAA